jgi:hypothetical protein
MNEGDHLEDGGVEWEGDNIEVYLTEIRCKGMD